MAFSADLRLIATTSNDATARVWEADRGRELTRISHSPLVSGVAFSPDGQKIVTVGRDKLRVWEANA